MFDETKETQNGEQAVESTPVQETVNPYLAGAEEPVAEKTVATVTALPTINAHKEIKQILFFVEDIIFLNTFSIKPSTLYPIIIF